jgi:hypothetical protein
MARIIRAQIVVFIGCFLFAGTLWAYGGGSGTTSACKKPKFSDFNPVHLAEVAPESGIFTVQLMPKCFPWRIENNNVRAILCCGVVS